MCKSEYEAEARKEQLTFPSSRINSLLGFLQVRYTSYNPHFAQTSAWVSQIFGMFGALHAPLYYSTGWIFWKVKQCFYCQYNDSYSYNWQETTEWNIFSGPKCLGNGDISAIMCHSVCNLRSMMVIYAALLRGNFLSQIYALLSIKFPGKL